MEFGDLLMQLRGSKLPQVLPAYGSVRQRGALLHTCILHEKGLLFGVFPASGGRRGACRDPGTRPLPSKG